MCCLANELRAFNLFQSRGDFRLFIWVIVQNFLTMMLKERNNQNYIQCPDRKPQAVPEPLLTSRGWWIWVAYAWRLHCGQSFAYRVFFFPILLLLSFWHLLICLCLFKDYSRPEVVSQWGKHHLQQLILEFFSNSWLIGFSACNPAFCKCAWGRQKVITEALGLLHPCGRQLWNSQFLASVLPTFRCSSHLRSEPWDGRSLSLPLFVSHI